MDTAVHSHELGGRVWRPRPLRLGLLLTLFAAMMLSMAPGVGHAQTEDPDIGLTGTFRNPGDEGPTPIEGVVVTVTDADGGEVGSATSDADGRWVFEVPATGEYTATVDPATLPDGVTLRDGETTSQTRQVNPGQLAPMLFPLGEGPAAVDNAFARRALQLFVEGLNLGLLIAMMAIGLSLIFGTTGLVNFAHGEMITLGALLAWTFNVTFGLHLLVAAVLAIAASAIVAGLMDLGIFRQLRKRGIGLISQLVITIGLSLFMRYGLLYLYRGDRRSYTQYNVQSGNSYGPIVLAPKDLWIMGISIVVLVGVGLLLSKTRVGRAMRAVSDNRDLAESSGIDVQRVILLVWAVGGGLAGLGGILWGVGESISWIVGFRLLLPIFAGMILGGIGTAYGALVGSLVVGIFIQMSTLVIPSELKNAAALLVLAIILVVRPQGILGQSERVG